jgi:hypothetical protein
MADVSSNLYDWSTTAASNGPSGTTTIGTGLDDNLREIQAVVRAALSSVGANIASAGTTDLGAVAGLAHSITGTTTITSFGTVSPGIWKVLTFAGVLTLTHNATSLILPGAASITTAAGDVAIVLSEGSGNWRCLSYQRATGLPIVGVAGINRFANGAFLFDQRNNGGTVTVNSASEFRCQDCCVASGTASPGVFTVTQGATGGPLGSQNFSRLTVSTIDAAMAAADNYQYAALIEGLDVASLGFGTANAQAISISFWFRSSLIGTYSGSVRNAAGTRSYTYSWVYPSTNVWQKVEIANIPGDTGGTWLTTAERSMVIGFDLGSGANWQTAAGAWVATDARKVTGTTDVINQIGATMDIALLQVEQRSACTPFEWVPYASGLARAQRYYASGTHGLSAANASGLGQTVIALPAKMRSAPTFTTTLGGGFISSTSPFSVGVSIQLTALGANAAAQGIGGYNWTAAAEL